MLKLFTPGPLQISHGIKVGMLHDIGSRDEYLVNITKEVRTTSLELANALESHECIPIQGSGTFGIEAAIDTFIDTSDCPLLLINGMYGKRIAVILESKGVSFSVIYSNYNEPHDLEEVERRIVSDNATHLLFVYCETTTGIQNPFHELVTLANKYGLKTLIDGVSAYGALPVDAQITPFDILVTSSNKCIESVPGISLCFVSHKVLFPLNSKARSYCLDLCEQWRSLDTSGQWRFTPPTHILQALKLALDALKSETVEARYGRYKSNMEILTHELTKVGLSPCVAPEYQSPICLAFSVSDIDVDFDFSTFYNELKALGILIYHKMDKDTNSFRIGCIGRLAHGDFKYLSMCVKDLIIKYTHKVHDNLPKEKLS